MTRVVRPRPTRYMYAPGTSSNLSTHWTSPQSQLIDSLDVASLDGSPRRSHRRTSTAGPEEAPSEAPSEAPLAARASSRHAHRQAMQRGHLPPAAELAAAAAMTAQATSEGSGREARVAQSNPASPGPSAAPAQDEAITADQADASVGGPPPTRAGNRYHRAAAARRARLPHATDTTGQATSEGARRSTAGVIQGDTLSPGEWAATEGGGWWGGWSWADRFERFF